MTVCLAVYGGDAIAGVVETQSEAEEPGGLRYRALLRKSEQAVSISVVSKPEGSYLLVVKRLSK